MEQLDTGTGLGWEQILIAGACLAVLLGVCFAAIRSARRGRRPTRMRTVALEPMSQRVGRAADRARARPDPLTPSRPVGSERRLEPSLARSAAEERRRPAAPPPPSRAEAEELRRPPASPPPPLPRSMEEPRRPPAPLPAQRGAEDDLAALARANADQARTIKALKSQLDEVRQTARLATRRLDALEAALERMRADEAAAARPGAQRRAPPLRPTAEPAPRESGDDAASPEPRTRPGIALRGERRER